MVLTCTLEPPSRRGFPLDHWAHGAGGRPGPHQGATHEGQLGLAPHHRRQFKLSMDLHSELGT